MQTNQLLIDEYPLLVYPSLAMKVGLNEAIVLQQIHYWLKKNQQNKHNFRGGHYWVYNTYEDWQRQFPWWCIRTIKGIFTKLEKDGYLVSENYNKLKTDRTKWYRINYDKFESSIPSCKICTMEGANFARSVPENTIKTNNGNNGDNGCTPERSTTSGDVLDQDYYDKYVGKVEEDTRLFIQWYFKHYEEVFGEPHPKIKSEQKKRVHENISDFCLEYGVEADGLQAMTDAFFEDVHSSDHNINHFATEGILKNRYYEALY